MAIKTILTDLGNVILYFDFHKLVRRLSERSGFLDVAIRDKLISEKSIYTLFAKGSISAYDFHTLICKELGMNLSFLEFKEVWCDIFTPNWRVIELWRRLRIKGYRIVLLSNLDRLHYMWVTKYFKLDFLDKELYSFQLRCIKPDEEIYRFALPHCKCDKSEVIFIDDLEPNVLAAREFGYHAIHYTGRIDMLCNKLKKLGVK